MFLFHVKSISKWRSEHTPSGDKMHKCSECQKSFGRAYHLKMQMIIHGKGKVHSSVQCSKSFGQAGNMKAHMLTHSGMKAHTCSECKKSFREAGKLRIHMITHTAQCVLCLLCFVALFQSFNLRPILKIEFWYLNEHIFVPACLIKCGKYIFSHFCDF